MPGRLTVISAVALFALGCNPLASFEPNVVTAAERFEVNATHVRHITGSAVYHWTNSSTRALVVHSTTTTSAGFASIAVYDDADNLVYSATLRPDFTQETTVGVAGTWTIIVTMTGYSGTLGVRLDRL